MREDTEIFFDDDLLVTFSDLFIESWKIYLVQSSGAVLAKIVSARFP